MSEERCGEIELIPCGCGLAPRWIPKTDYGEPRWWIACQCGMELATAHIKKLDAGTIWNKAMRRVSTLPTASDKPEALGPEPCHCCVCQGAAAKQP